jgi:hypothetical protein
VTTELRISRPGARACCPGHPFLKAFDLLELNGNDLRREPFEVRKATLASLLRARRVESTLIDLPIDLLVAHLDAVVLF